VRSRWGSEGGIDLIAARSARWDTGQSEWLQYSVIGGSCRSEEVLGYLDALAEQTEGEGKPCVVVLDDAPFHTAGVVREREPEWAARGLVFTGCRPTVRT
jgi:putative transposase